MAGALFLEANLRACLRLVCDRCAKPFSREKRVHFETLLATSLENADNDDIVLLQDEKLELDELMSDVFLLALDTKNLCKEDCKALCPVCGKDLNEGNCGCSANEADPRFEALRDLL
jgi:uncharacterized protein